MAENVLAKKPFQEGLEDSLLDYYDIMVIGRTGMGKSTTVDKLLIAKLAGMQHPEQQETVARLDTDRNTLTHGDMTMWLVSDKDFDFDKVNVRLKNLVFFRSLKNPHQEVNTARQANMHIYESTNHCELLSNETTKIRILDVPGFFGRDAASPSGIDLKARALATNSKDLGMMRKVLHIKQAHNLKFSRIVYFLPDKGSLKRTSQNLIQEVGIMEHYFGRAIFNSMVVAATLSSDAYEHIPDDGKKLFSERQFQETRDRLQEAIRQFFPDDDLPKPPIIFISLFDTCESILHQIQSAKVKETTIQLELRKSVCARCGVMIVEEGKNEVETEPKAAICTYSNQLGSIAHNESTCHPLMILKYSKLSKFFGGIAHLITLRRFVGKWPNFTSMDEECFNCKQAPGTQGCLKIGSKFAVDKDEIIVLHSATAEEQRQIEIEEETEQLPQASASPVSPTVGSGSPEGAAPSQRNGRQYVYQDGEHTVVPKENPPDFDIKGT